MAKAICVTTDTEYHQLSSHAVDVTRYYFVRAQNDVILAPEKPIEYNYISSKIDLHAMLDTRFVSPMSMHQTCNYGVASIRSSTLGKLETILCALIMTLSFRLCHLIRKRI
jgi:hypothetical protein